MADEYVCKDKYTEFISEGKIQSKTWASVIRGKYDYHRIGGPAYIKYYDSGLVFFEEFYINGILHREDGPAKISYYADGSIEFERFFFYGDYIGESKKGFWALWDRLDEDGRKNPELLKYLMRFS